MSVAGQSQLRKHRSPRILPNQVRETPSIPVRRVRKDVLLDERHALRSNNKVLLGKRQLPNKEDSMKNYESLSHTRYDCKYHVVFIP